MRRHVILLRGVNVGQRRLPMALLRETLTAAGMHDVSTLLQSGNAVVSSELDEGSLVELCERTISEAAGFDVPVVVRSGDELAAVLKANPLATVATDPKRYLVSFCATPPGEEALALLNEACGEGEEAAVLGREIFTWHPDGVGRSKLWDRAARLGRGRGGLPLATARNWSTVRALSELAAEG